MMITIGMQLGSHEITGLLGRGGMGEVYRARDTKVRREVAIKVLPDEFSRGTENTDSLDRRGDKPLPVSNQLHLEARVNSAHLAEASAQGRPGQPPRCQIRYIFAAFDQNLAFAPVNYCDFVQAINGADMNSLHLLEFVNLRPVPPRVLGPLIQNRPPR